MLIIFHNEIVSKTYGYFRRQKSSVNICRLSKFVFDMYNYDVNSFGKIINKIKYPVTSF